MTSLAIVSLNFLLLVFLRSLFTSFWMTCALCPALVKRLVCSSPFPQSPRITSFAMFWMDLLGLFSLDVYFGLAYPAIRQSFHAYVFRATCLDVLPSIVVIVFPFTASTKPM